VLDADIKGFFDAIDHEKMMKILMERITDKRLLRQIKKWLKAGIMEEGKLLDAEKGVPQGGNLSPLLSNIYLHYALDIWTHNWRINKAKGDVIIVRYCDDFVVGFQYREEGKRYLTELKERLKKFNLELNEEKTRLIEYGRFSTKDRRNRGEKKPETFNFLGFTHISGKKRNGYFALIRHTDRKKLKRKIQEIKEELRKRMHNRPEETGKWLASVIRGHNQYYGVPFNSRALSRFRHLIVRQWYRTLKRRSQRKPKWERIKKLIKYWLPMPKIHHPYPEERFNVRNSRQEPGAGKPHAGICAGGGEQLSFLP